MGTIVTAAVLVCIVGLVIRKMVRDRKSGKSMQCGCDCGNCGGCQGVRDGRNSSVSRRAQ